MRRYKDWLKQSELDLSAAEDSLETRHYEWSSFQSQQCAEKAVKALIQYENLEIRSHSVLELLEYTKEHVKLSIPSKLFESARELDRHYITPRYPNGFPSGYPLEYYDEQTARRCIEHAKKIIGFAKKQIE